MIGVVESRADAASIAIADALRDHGNWTEHRDEGVPTGAGGGTVHRRAGVELRSFEDLHIHLEGAADPFGDVDCLVFASRHAGDTGPLLTAHFTGNFGPAEYGGEPGDLAEAAPGAQTAAVSALHEHAPDGYDVGIECTHHGPSDLDVPSLFVEVGSGPDEWNDPDAATAAVAAILAVRDVDPQPDRTVVGFGGGHYAPRFARIVEETDHAVGHIAADWALEADPGDAVLRAAFERSDATRALLDGDGASLAGTIEAMGYRVVGERWLREVTGVPLDRVEALETALRPVADGLCFGELAGARGDFVVRTPDADLLAAVNGVDADAVRAAVAAHTVAYVAEENGNRVVGPVAVSDQDGYDVLLDSLVTILDDAFEHAEREDGAIVVTERAFDPDRAAALGVDAGPAFGRLAAGESVSVDGREVTPDEVHVERTRRYPV